MSTHRNRLADEASPYLRQHADNPVNWQPWDETALAAARDRDVPIFLSIGYSACHWCHVMEDESFADEEVARVLNEHFVPIKVDREERPDVDSIYMTVCQLVTGRGGWPLSAWLTPDGRPFYVGTYFPKHARQGMPGFLEVLENVRHSWETDRDEIENRADQWTDAAKNRLEETPAEAAVSQRVQTDRQTPTSELLSTAADAILRSADREYGGFGSSGPKFPQPARIHLLLRAADRTGRQAYLDVARESLDAMAAGGLYDHVGDGFHRYCVDRDWTVPHFEKMLYDNAELPRAYLAAYQAIGEEHYAEVVHRTLAFVERALTHEDGGFFSTLDAQSETTTGEREEGAFYVWTPEQIEAVLGDGLDAELFCARYGITDAGNFEGETVLTVSTSIAELAADYDLERAAIESRLERAREQVFDARATRPRPNRDEKILAGWNGLMITTFAEAAITLGEDAYAETAVDALEFVWATLWDDEEKRLSRRYKDGDVAIDGYLEDYAFLARGALTCHEATGDRTCLGVALELARAIETEFWDPEQGTIYFTPESGESLVTRPQQLDDSSTPSSTGVAVETLLALDHVADAAFGSIAETVLETHANTLEANPLGHTSLCLAADRAQTGSLELTVAADSIPREWRDAVGSHYLPDRLLTRRPPTASELEAWLTALGLETAPPVWAGREAHGAKPTLYVCRDRTCSPPTHDIEDGLEWALSSDSV